MVDPEAGDPTVLRIALPDGRQVLSVMGVDASGEPQHTYRVIDHDRLPRDFAELSETARFLDAQDKPGAV
jgi:hypothetical protein